MTNWFVRFLPRAEAQARLICFPYAGAGAGIFNSWPYLLPEWLDVAAIELPGRGSHFSKAPLVDIETVVNELVREVAQLQDLPFALYGHSLGAKIAFEFACELQRRQGPRPAHLIVGARAAPHQPIQISPSPADLPREGFVEFLRDLGATPPEVLENRELMDLLLPTIHADFRLNESRPAKPWTALHCPITALCGATDRAVSKEFMRHWADLTTRRFDLIPVEGDHFFLHQSKETLLAIVTKLMRRVRLRA
jgi:medium-chain acyl-[acyl-carrier-protein] hydrolase